jgi:hypothetical protein
MKGTKTTVMTVILLMILTLAACSKNSGGSNPSDSSGNTATQSNTPTFTGGTWPDNHTPILSQSQARELLGLPEHRMMNTLKVSPFQFPA